MEEFQLIRNRLSLTVPDTLNALCSDAESVRPLSVTHTHTHTLSRHTNKIEIVSKLTLDEMHKVSTQTLNPYVVSTPYAMSIEKI